MPYSKIYSWRCNFHWNWFVIYIFVINCLCYIHKKISNKDNLNSIIKIYKFINTKQIIRFFSTNSWSHHISMKIQINFLDSQNRERSYDGFIQNKNFTSRYSSKQYLFYIISCIFSTRIFKKYKWTMHFSLSFHLLLNI